MKAHTYTTDLVWSGSTGAGYRAYDRAHDLAIGDSARLAVSADPAFRGDATLANPEQLLLGAASSCQLLSFLAVAALTHVDVVRYSDSATAVMPPDARPMRITEISLNPVISVRGADAATVQELVRQAHEQCYIGNTLNARVSVAATVEVIDG
ncbi:OsmC family protein [Agromyces laixinhei]|uniref:OsmC family protein n=1 Tax=Agromyces laixinhei TaxID=2585717 RepID=UPI001116E2AE|nr:OsmC family protein [Agromyces laixinhei]